MLLTRLCGPLENDLARGPWFADLCHRHLLVSTIDVGVGAEFFREIRGRLMSSKLYKTYSGRTGGRWSSRHHVSH